MTVFLGSPTLTTIAPLVSSDKGSFGNRVNCAGSQAWNAFETGATVGATVVVTDYAVKHKDQFSKLYNGTKEVAHMAVDSKVGQKATSYLKGLGTKIKETTLFKDAAKFISNMQGKFKPIAKKVSSFLTPYVKMAKNAFNKLPKSGKVAFVAAIGLALLNGIYKSGQIDQKYTDRAKMEKNMV